MSDLIDAELDRALSRQVFIPPVGSRDWLVGGETLSTPAIDQIADQVPMSLDVAESHIDQIAANTHLVPNQTNRTE